jgi:diguanylate cyclase (GGDEF)-like protein/PAS domain S-box-containing protein
MAQGGGQHLCIRWRRCDEKYRADEVLIVRKVPISNNVTENHCKWPRMTQISTHRLSGYITCIYCTLLLADSKSSSPIFGTLIPGAERAGLANVLLLFAAACGILTLGSGAERVQRFGRVALGVSVCALVVLPIAFIAETAFGLDLHIDIPLGEVAPTFMKPHPGRISPNAAIAFLAIGIGLSALAHVKFPMRRRVVAAATVIVSVISASALAGYALGLENLYRIGSFNRMLPNTAIASLVCATGIWSLEAGDVRDPRNPYSEREIYRRAALLFALIALTGSIAGFSLFRGTFEEAAAKSLFTSATSTANTLDGEIDTSLTYAEMISRQPGLGEALKAWTERHDVEPLHARITQHVAPYLGDVIIGAQVIDVQDHVIFEAGQMTGRTVVRHTLQTNRSRATLLWLGGYAIETDTDIVANGRRVGRLVLQSRPRRFANLLDEIRYGSATSDAVVCGTTAVGVLCAPTRFRPSAFRLPLDPDPSTTAATMTLALAGHKGTKFVRDPRGANVISAFSPIGHYGIALGLKVDVDTLYSPIRDHLYKLVLVMGGIIAAGTLALRQQVRPLLVALAKEQRRTADILENSNDAFVALDDNGIVTSWNAQAVRTFGWNVDEAIGKKLSELIVPPDSQKAHDAGMQRFRHTGEGDVVNRRVELMARHRDGHLIPVELSVRAEQAGKLFSAYAFLHDISERKAAQEALNQSEARLKLIANNLPALISYIDVDYRYRFTNNQYQRWFDLEEGATDGKTVAEVFGEHVFAGVQQKIDEALKGNHVAFERLNPVPDAPENLFIHYIPDRDQNGRVVGVFGMVLDRTEQHRAQVKIEESERHLQAVADNLPVLITYIDREERIQFMNATGRNWFSLDPAQQRGRHIKDVFGTALYEERRKELAAALSGHRVEFDIQSIIHGVPHYLQTVYVPDTRPDGSTAGIFTLSMDVTKLKTVEQELLALSRIDSLTGLPNRRQFEEHLDDALARAGRSKNAIALFFLDIDKFKTINDTYGHGVGDSVLIEFAKRLQSVIRKTDLAVRLAGDEFVIILENMVRERDVVQLADKLVNQIRMPFDIGFALHVTSSVGIAYLSEPIVARDVLLSEADAALYDAKAAGRNCYSLRTVMDVKTLQLGGVTSRESKARSG